MNPLLQQFLVATLRHWLTMLGMWLLSKGLIGLQVADVETFAAGFAVLLVAFLWSYWNKYKSRVLFLTALESTPGTPEPVVTEKARKLPPGLTMLLVLGVALSSFGCAAKSAPVVVAQASLGIAQSVEALQTGAIELQQAGVITASAALRVQQRLLVVNGMVEKVIPYLKAIDRLSASNVKPTQTELDALITQVYLALTELGLVGADVPGGAATASYLALVRQVQTTLTTTMIELARLRVALEG